MDVTSMDFSCKVRVACLFFGTCSHVCESPRMDSTLAFTLLVHKVTPALCWAMFCSDRVNSILFLVQLATSSRNELPLTSNLTCFSHSPTRAMATSTVGELVPVVPPVTDASGTSPATTQAGSAPVVPPPPTPVVARVPRGQRRCWADCGPPVPTGDLLKVGNSSSWRYFCPPCNNGRRAIDVPHIKKFDGVSRRLLVSGSC